MSNGQPDKIPTITDRNRIDLDSLVLQRAAEGKSWREIAQELISMGIDAKTAKNMAKNAIDKPGWADKEWELVLIGLLILAVFVLILWYIIYGIFSFQNFLENYGAP